MENKKGHSDSAVTEYLHKPNNIIGLLTRIVQQKIATQTTQPSQGAMSPMTGFLHESYAPTHTASVNVQDSHLIPSFIHLNERHINIT